jgi:predicted metal-dependent enzyme (double-stranded beta helix superfamily)
MAGDKRIERGHAALLGPAIIHAVANPLSVFTGGIHIDGGDFVATTRSQWTPDTFEERPFDVEQGRRVFAEANERWRRARGLAGGKEATA